MYPGTASYHKVAVETADQKTLIVLCYDEAIRSLQMGKALYLKKRFEEKFNQFTRAQSFISELSTGLNMEAGGEIAQNLRALYDFFIKSITKADIQGDMRLVDQTVKMLSELRSAWVEIDTRPSAGVMPNQSYGQVAMAARGFAV